MSERAIKQMAMETTGFSGIRLVALCEDGTLWQRYEYWDFKDPRTLTMAEGAGRWYRLPGPPSSTQENET